MLGVPGVIDKYLANLLVYLGVAVLFWILHRLFTGQRFAARGGEEGRIRPSTLFISLSLLACLFLIGGAGYFLLEQGHNPVALGMMTAAIVMLLLTLFMTGDENQVRWNREGIRGPGFLPFLPGVSRTVHLDWGEIRRGGESVLRMRYVEGDDGRRVYWSRCYAGHEALERALEEKRPDLFGGI